jgi:GNAT superfamily N-acetyltransferase
MKKHIFSHSVHTPVNTFGIAKPVQSMFVPSIKTLEVEKAANDELMEVNFRELTKVGEKYKWQTRFSEAYAGGVNPLSAEVFDPCISIFVVAAANGMDAGYMRLVKVTIPLEHGYVSVWSLDTAYVKERYRNRGILYKLISHAVDAYNIKQISLEAYRFYNNKLYYESLGFPYFLYVNNTDLGYAIHDSFHQMIACMKPLAA